MLSQNTLILTIMHVILREIWSEGVGIRLKHHEYTRDSAVRLNSYHEYTRDRREG